LEVGGWRLEVGGWRLEVGGWRLEVGGWRLEAKALDPRFRGDDGEGVMALSDSCTPSER
jgi:hypothetical protein